MAVSVVYCGVCTAPPEYCEFGPSAKRCKAWLQEKYPDLYTKLYPPAEPASADVAAVSAKVGEIALGDGAAPGAPAPGDKKAEESSGKLDALQKQELKKEKAKQAARVTIKRIERTKRKCVIVVAGLEVFEVDLKKASKLFATKFACGSSVTKNPAGYDEIVVQGDCQDDIYELIRKTWKNIPSSSIEMD
ncbi:translation initiation factor SUI1 [Chytriomyces sp. MP71]|nr:translation initiation factor SUI1 [Chytriomyces sp. MP71]